MVSTGLDFGVCVCVCVPSITEGTTLDWGGELGGSGVGRYGMVWYGMVCLVVGFQ